MDPSSKVLDALNQLTRGALDQFVQQKQQEQYFEGMSEVAQGKSLLEIQKEQPWYAKIFGPGATVRGAQAMTMMSAMDDAQSTFLQNMPELRKQSPDVVRKYLVDQAKQIGSTGDPATDAMVQAKLAEQFGPMLDLHMKQHVAYVQEQNVTTFGNTLVSAGDTFQTARGVGDGFYTPEQQEQQKARALAAFQPLPGMTDEAWGKATAQAMQANMLKGNFAIVDAFKQTPEYQKLPLDTRNALERMQPYAVQWVQKNNPLYQGDASDTAGLHVALSQGSGPQSIEQLDKYIDSRNAAWTQKTGASTPFFDNDERARMHVMWFQGQEYLRRQQAPLINAYLKGEQQARDAQQQQTDLLDGMSNGRAPIALDHMSADVVQATLRASFADSQRKGPEALRSWVGKLAVASQWGAKTVDSDLKNQLTTDANNFFVQGTLTTDGMRNSLGLMQVMATSPNGVAALAQYVGPENAAKMTMLVQSGVNLSDKSAVDAVRQAVQNGWKADVTQKDIKEAQAAIDGEDPGFLKRNIPIFGPGSVTGYDLNDDSKRRMAQDLAPNVARYMRGMGMDRDTATQLAFAQMFGPSSNVDFIDGTYVPGSLTSRGQGTGLFAAVAGRIGGLSQTSEDYQEAVRNVITQNMAGAVGKVPIKTADKRTNVAGKAMNNLLNAVPFVGDQMPRPFSEQGLTPDPNTFDPDDYKSVSGMPIGAGVVQITRVPKTNDRGMRPVTVTITADQVIREFDNVKRKRAEQAKPFGLDMPAYVPNP
ncbi:hypothetical protein CAL26_21095 [Bordetella genomosp. 9]|uniref:Uncharacterized protein n=2 Tax=Bordetella genomosp. 9 TaxID=1416803 RepID=A0A261R6T2_9BORD|nr:hypothetical protein CAL26_21095 [Bordetella genomosp. 9]